MTKNNDLVKKFRDAATMSEAFAVLLPHSEGNAMAKLYKEAADVIEERDRRILTLQHEMMAEAESHLAEVNRLNKQIKELQADMRPAVRGKWIEHNYDPEYLSCDFSCSECNVYLEEYYFGEGQWPGKTDHYFCPNCGADMREQSEEGD